MSNVMGGSLRNAYSILGCAALVGFFLTGCGPVQNRMCEAPQPPLADASLRTAIQSRPLSRDLPAGVCAVSVKKNVMAIWVASDQDAVAEQVRTLAGLCVSGGDVLGAIEVYTPDGRLISRREYGGESSYARSGLWFAPVSFTTPAFAPRGLEVESSGGKLFVQPVVYIVDPQTEQFDSVTVAIDDQAIKEYVRLGLKVPPLELRDQYAHNTGLKGRTLYTFRCTSPTAGKGGKVFESGQ